MPSHKFKISLDVQGCIYEVTKQLAGEGECQYRIKSANEPHERVARESELTKA